MQALETLVMMVGLFIFYGICFIFGMAIFIFVSFVGIVMWLSGLFGAKEVTREDKVEDKDQPPCQ